MTDHVKVVLDITVKPCEDNYLDDLLDALIIVLDDAPELLSLMTSHTVEDIQIESSEVTDSR